MLNFLGKLTSTKSTDIGAAPGRRGAAVRVPFAPEIGRGRGGGVQLLDPAAMKSSSDFYSRAAMDFINAANNDLSVPYTEQQLLGAYLTSVYMFSALRRVANLMSRVKVVAEISENGKWVRAPETVKINQIFAKEGSEVLSRMWLNYAVYGATAVYKVKTRRSIMEEEVGRPIYGYRDGAVAGLYVIDKPLWDLDEDVTYGEIKGLHVTQYNLSDAILGNKNYLNRDEFVYHTEWNPENPNRGRSIVAGAIHEAVANAAIAQWMAEYFTRGTMPYIVVTMEDDPAMMTEADLRKIKRQFEEYSQGIGASLRSVFFDRDVKIQQVGIAADEVAAPELNETALEGIAAAVGLDRELVVTPSGGSQERHEQLVMRAWNDTIIPTAQKFLVAFNRDLGMPPNMRLVLDLSDISELEADRQEKSDTELSIFDAGLQDYNETRKRLKMPPVEDFDGWYKYNDRVMPIDEIRRAAIVPNQVVVDFATQLWDSNLAKRSEVLSLLGRQLPTDARDGYKYDIEESFDFVSGLWDKDLLTRGQVLGFIGYTMPADADDGYRSELERGADYGKFITELWSDNLLTRSQTMTLLNMGLQLPEGSPDGYSDEIGDRKTNVMDMWGDNLLTRSEAMNRLGVTPQPQMPDGFKGEVEAEYERMSGEEQRLFDNVGDWWDGNLLTRGQAVEMLKIPSAADGEMMDGFKDEIDTKLQKQSNLDDRVVDMWDKNLLQKSAVLENLGFGMPEGVPDGYQQETDIINEALANKRATDITGEPPEDNGGGGGGFGGFGRSWSPDKLPPTAPSGAAETPDYAGDDYSLDATTDYQVIPDKWVHDAQDAYSNHPAYADDEVGSDADEEGDIDSAEDWNSFRAIDPTTPENYYDEIADADYLYDVLAEYIEPDEEDFSEGSIPLDAETLAQIEEDVIRDFVPETLGDEAIDRLLAMDGNVLMDAFTEALLAPADMIHVDQDLEGAISESLESIYFLETGEILDIDGDTLPEEKDESLYVSLWIGDNAALDTIQQKLLDVMPDAKLDLQKQGTYHITLTHTDAVTDIMLANVLDILPADINAVTLRVGGVTTFENEDVTVIKLDVENSQELSDLQQRVSMAFNAQGVPLSPLANASQFSPHITLAYAPPGTEVPPLNEFAVVRPLSITFGRDGYIQVAEIPLDEQKDAEVEAVQVEAEVESETESVRFAGTRDFVEPYIDWNSWGKGGTPQEQLEDRKELNRVKRETNITLLHRWLGGQISAESNALADHIKTAVAAYEASPEVAMAAEQAIRAGWFDEPGAFAEGENPIAKYLSEKTETIQQKMAGKAYQQDALAEIRAWERATVRGGIKKAMRFETVHLKFDLAEKVKAALADTEDKDSKTIRSVFEAARTSISEKSSRRKLTRERLDRWAARAQARKELFDFPDDEEE